MEIDIGSNLENEENSLAGSLDFSVWNTVHVKIYGEECVAVAAVDVAVTTSESNRESNENEMSCNLLACEGEKRHTIPFFYIAARSFAIGRLLQLSRSFSYELLKHINTSVHTYMHT